MNLLYDHDEEISGEQLSNIGCEYDKLGYVENAKKCFELAMKKEYYPAIVYLAKHYLEFEKNVEQFISLNEIALSHGIEDAAISLLEYYDDIQDNENKLKYLKICVDDFNSTDKLYDIIMYYKYMFDEENCIIYCNKLINNKDHGHNYKNGHFLLGQLYKHISKYSEMIHHYKLFLSSIEKKDIPFDDDIIIDMESKVLFVINIFITNEIDLVEIQEYMNKFNIKSDRLTTIIQLKINKTKLIEYNKMGECPICRQTELLQIFDCLGHYFCKMCTVKLEDECAICKCPKWKY